MPDLTAREWYYKWATKIALGVLIPIGCWIYGWILVRMRAAVLHTQRVNSVAFAGDALRSTFSTLLLQFLILARFSGFAFNYPNGIFRGAWAPVAAAIARAAAEPLRNLTLMSHCALWTDVAIPGWWLR